MYEIMRILLLLLLLVHGATGFGVNHKIKATITTSPPATSIQETTTSSRRSIVSTSFQIAVGGLITGWTVDQQPATAAFSLFPEKNHRQLELCVVSILRLQYWAQTVAFKLQTAETIDQRTSAYIEARLGAKAIVAGKIGGGASYPVFVLKSLQIRECLTDLQYYAAQNSKKDKKQTAQLAQDLIESLASLVEFDGLETTTDPSPRSSLTLSMYTDTKGNFVNRMLSERIVGLCQDIVRLLGPDTREVCDGYILQYYSSELPPNPKPPPKVVEDVPLPFE
jgi:hypothetical protein